MNIEEQAVHIRSNMIAGVFSSCSRRGVDINHTNQGGVSYNGQS
jgi:hypothetical protein